MTIVDVVIRSCYGCWQCGWRWRPLLIAVVILVFVIVNALIVVVAVVVVSIVIVVAFIVIVVVVLLIVVVRRAICSIRHIKDSCWRCQRCYAGYC